MLEPLDIKCLSLRIDSENVVTLDIQVGEQWRRVIKTFHAGYTHWNVSRGALEIGNGTSDVTAEYQEYQEGEE
jgi:hypothetical protein